MSVIEENWDFIIDLDKINKKSYNIYKKDLITCHEFIMKLLEDSFIDKKVDIAGDAQKQDEELKKHIENNELLRNQIDMKLNKLSHQQTQYKKYKKDQNILSQEIKETHEAFLLAKKYYKKFLKLYFTIDSKNENVQTVLLQFFTEAKKESDNYSVRLVRHIKSGRYELLSTGTKLPTLEEIQRRLQETNDVPGLLCYIRQLFVNIKNKSK